MDTILDRRSVPIIAIVEGYIDKKILLAGTLRGAVFEFLNSFPNGREKRVSNAKTEIEN